VISQNVAFLRHQRAVVRDYRFAPSVDSIREARRRVRDALEPHSDPDVLGRIELVVSELVTNAVRHGPGKPISLRLVTAPHGTVWGEVADHGAGVVAIREQEPGTIGGLGLPIVNGLVSAWGVYPGSSDVWFRFDPA
jgi:anti-sigma regulatory factor (Ser/Thr protein kinase)